MPMKPREMEKLILADGWMFKNQEGSHKNYIHPTKPGKVTIPFHQGKDLNKKRKIPSKNRRGLNSSIAHNLNNIGGVLNVINVSCMFLSGKQRLFRCIS